MDTYVGISTRKAGSVTGSLADCCELWTLFTDFDFKDISEADAWQRLETFPIAPHLVVHSGNGLHVYWRLREPFTLPAEADLARQWLTRLAAALGSDPKVAEPVRILRLPGTWNHKYGTPRPVQVLRHSPGEINASDLEEIVPAAPSAKPLASAIATVSAGGRNTALASMAGSMRRRGFDTEAIVAALQIYNAKQCHPPLPKFEVDQIARSVSRYPPEPGPEGEQAPPPAAGLTFTRPAVDGHEDDHVLVSAHAEGWFPRSSVSLIAGHSGTGKSSLLLPLLVGQRARQQQFGRTGAGLPFIVITADRGKFSNNRTLRRLGLRAADVPMRKIPPTAFRDKAVRAILGVIEAEPEIPPVVFIEGLDLLCVDATKAELVAAFLGGLQQMAEHYHLAIIGSVGSPKIKADGGYQITRDQVYGSQVWGRMTETVLLLRYENLEESNGRRILLVEHRNAASEKLLLNFVNGKLVESTLSPEAAAEDSLSKGRFLLLAYAKERGTFRAADVRHDLPRLAGATRKRLLGELVDAGQLLTKRKGGETTYTYVNGMSPAGGT